MIHLLRRDLALVLRARTTWWMAALSSVLISHGFLRALERVRTPANPQPLGPMLRGLYIALCIFGPVVGARALAIEKERRTFHTLLLQTRSIGRVLVSKWVSGTCGVFLAWITVALLLAIWRGSVGTLGLEEAAVTLLGYAIYSGYVTAVGVAAASLVPTFRDALLLAWFTIGWNLATDVSDSVRIFGWLRSNQVWSPGTYLQRFEQGAIELSAIAWLCTASSTGFLFAWCGCRFDVHGSRRWLMFGVATAIATVACLLAREVPGSWDYAALGWESTVAGR